MTTLREAAQQALEALERLDRVMLRGPLTDAAITALRAALAEPVQGPKGYFSVNDYGRWEENENTYGTPLYTTPPQRKPLTDEEIDVMSNDFEEGYVFLYRSFARAIERAHGIGGNDE